MATLQVRNVSEDAARRLRVRAAANGQSLQELLRLHLEEWATQPTVAEWLAAVESRPRASFPASEVVRLIRDDRDAR
jgi:plasmid stability protein